MKIQHVPSGQQTDEAISWLLDGDPAIRWQTMRDLTGAGGEAAERERRKVPREGWGARLLAKQGRDGRWARGKSSDSGLYSPKWISTTYTMLMLRDFGLPQANRQAQKACGLLLDRGLQPDGGLSYGTWAKWTRSGETCISGMVLSILSYFQHDDARLDTVARHVLDEQMPDGGWNCRRPQGATHSSVHTTISVLEGLRHYERWRGAGLPALRAAQQRGREFLLAHRLFRSHRTGAIIKPEFLRFSFPPRWHYDVLRGLDYFQAVDAPRDPRLEDAVEVVRRHRRPEGRWDLQNRYPGKTYFEMERVGAPSRWNTLRALRVLKWWEKGSSPVVKNLHSSGELSGSSIVIANGSPNTVVASKVMP
ncbi:MAG TPA: hypothetical protein VGZ29_16800 [Terriglobia bacterium]|nr:hypothetical protein [Terriglobia bacterium]